MIIGVSAGDGKAYVINEAGLWDKGPQRDRDASNLEELAQAARWGSRAGKSLTREWSEISEFARERWRNVVRAVLVMQEQQNGR